MPPASPTARSLVERAFRRTGPDDGAEGGSVVKSGLSEDQPFGLTSGFLSALAKKRRRVHGRFANESSLLIPRYNVALELGKRAGGSNGARWAFDKNGTRYLSKHYGGDQNRVATELAANAVYRVMGARVPMAGLHDGGVPAVAYPALEGKPRPYVFHDGGPSEELAQHFMVDALLGNWDVAGLADDNILHTPDGPARIDQGGTFEFRAMGGRKEYGPVPLEVRSMLARGGQGRRMVGELPDAELRAQARDIAERLTPERVDAIFDDAPFRDQEMSDRVRANLKARVAWMGRFGSGELGRPSLVESFHLLEPLVEAAIISFLWDKYAHPRDEHGRFRDAVGHLSPGASIRLDEHTKIRKEKDGPGFILHKKSQLVKFRGLGDAVRGALDYSAKQKNGAVGGGVSYKDYNAGLAAGGYDPLAPATFGGYTNLSAKDLEAEVDALKYRLETAKASDDVYVQKGVPTIQARLVEAEKKLKKFKPASSLIEPKAEPKASELGGTPAPGVLKSKVNPKDVPVGGFIQRVGAVGPGDGVILQKIDPYTFKVVATPGHSAKSWTVGSVWSGGWVKSPKHGPIVSDDDWSEVYPPEGDGFQPDLDGLHTGAVVHVEASDTKYVKQSSGEWKSMQTGQLHPASEFKHLVDDGQVKVLPVADAVGSPTLKVGDPAGDPAALPVGTRIAHEAWDNESGYYEKLAPGKWGYKGNWGDLAKEADLTDAWVIKSLPQEAPAKAVFLTSEAQAASIPVGTKITHSETGASYTKTGTDEWTSHSPDYSTTDSAVSASGKFEVQPADPNPQGLGVPAAAKPIKGFQPNPMKSTVDYKGDPVELAVPLKDLDVGIGDVIQYKKGGWKYTIIGMAGTASWKVQASNGATKTYSGFQAPAFVQKADGSVLQAKDAAAAPAAPPAPAKSHADLVADAAVMLSSPADQTAIKDLPDGSIIGTPDGKVAALALTEDAYKKGEPDGYVKAYDIATGAAFEPPANKPPVKVATSLAAIAAGKAALAKLQSQTTVATAANPTGSIGTQVQTGPPADFDGVPSWHAAADELVKQQQSGVGLTSEEKSKVKAYTGSYYTVVNAQARASTGVGELQVGKDIASITRAINKCPAFEKDVVIGRRTSVSEWANAKAGQTIQDNGFLSCSTNQGTWSGDVHLTILARKGTRGLILGAGGTVGSNHPGESEVILQRGTMFHVLKREDNGSTTKLYVEVLV